MGATTAADLDVDIGDRLTLFSDQAESREIEIVGTTVLPSLGSFLADRTGLGRGAYVVLGDDEITDDGITLTAVRPP